MKDILYQYYRPTNEDFDNLWKNCLIIPDTNVILNLYRYSKNTSDDFINIFNLFSDRLWIPYQIALEYHKNRLNVISAQYQVYKKLSELFEKQENIINTELNRIGKHPYIEISEYQEQVSTFFSNIKQKLADGKENHPDLIENDHIRDIITKMFEGKVGPQYSSEKLIDIYREGKKRFENQIPPGFEDLKQKEGNNAYSDLILWLQIIDKAKEIKKPVIFITDEMKNDWWWKFDGKIIGPRPELIEEIVTKSNVWFYMYRPDQFLTSSKNYLNQQINQSAVKEVRDIQNQDNEQRKVLNYLLNEIKATNSKLAQINFLESEIRNEIEITRHNLDDAESTAENYKLLDIEPGYQTYMIDVDRYQSQLYNLEAEQEEFHQQRMILENTIKMLRDKITGIENEISRFNYESKIFPSSIKSKKRG